jgi:hypothetical protein
MSVRAITTHRAALMEYAPGAIRGLGKHHADGMSDGEHGVHLNLMKQVDPVQGLVGEEDPRRVVLAIRCDEFAGKEEQERGVVPTNERVEFTHGALDVTDAVVCTLKGAIHRRLGDAPPILE